MSSKKSRSDMCTVDLVALKVGYMVVSNKQDDGLARLTMLWSVAHKVFGIKDQASISGISSQPGMLLFSLSEWGGGSRPAPVLDALERRPWVAC